MKKYVTFINASITVSLVVMIYFMLNLPFNDGSGIRQSDKFGHFGDFIGGFLGTVISLIGIIYIYKAFQSQREELNLQKNNSAKERFESRYFEMLRSNRQIVQDLSHTVPDLPKAMREDHSGKHQGIIVTGQKVFLKIHEQILKAHQLVKEFCVTTEISNMLNPEALDTERRTFLNYYGSEKAKDDHFVKQLFEIRLAYLGVFFGVDKTGRKILSKFLSQSFQPLFLNSLLNKLEAEKADWDKSIMYFGGHQHRLGHYFRNLYYLVNFVNDEQHLSYNEKYHYIKHLRSQFSTYEQSVFFCNSISPMGLVWEISAGSDKSLATPPTKITKQKKKSVMENANSQIANCQLITKYNLIKNIPQEFIADIELGHFYPNVEYEVGKSIPEKEELKKLYK